MQIKIKKNNKKINIINKNFINNLIIDLIKNNYFEVDKYNNNNNKIIIYQADINYNYIKNLLLKKLNNYNINYAVNFKNDYNNIIIKYKSSEFILNLL